MNQEDIIKSNMIKIPDLMNLLHSSYSIMKNVELNIYFKTTRTGIGLNSTILILLALNWKIMKKKQWLEPS